jgi:hypothetical protein
LLFFPRFLALLRSRRTALYLLVIITAALAVSSFLPHPEFTEGFTVWQQENYVLYRLLSSLGLLAVHGSWWFILLSLCLLFSTALCLPQMWRRLWRLSSRDGMEGRVFFLAAGVPGATGNVRKAVEMWLKERNLPFHCTEKKEERAIVWGAPGRAWPSSFGVLLLHVAVVAFALSGISTGLLGYRGNVSLIEGQSFRDKRDGGYSAFWAGPLALPFGEAQFTLLAVRPLAASPYSELVRLEVFDTRTGRRAEKELRLNQAGIYRGLRLYARQYGFAMGLNVADAAGRHVFDGFVGLQRRETPAGVTHEDSFTLPLPGGLMRASARFSPPEAGQDAVLEIFIAGKTEEEEDVAAVLAPGEGVWFGNHRVEFSGVRYYQRFHVVRDIGIWFFALGSGLLFLGSTMYYFFPDKRAQIYMLEKGDILTMSGIFRGPGKRLREAEFALFLDEINREALLSDE